MQSVSRVDGTSIAENERWPVIICLLGTFRVLKGGKPVSIRAAGKTEALLTNLAMRRELSAPRDELLELLWPNSDQSLAGQSLNSLVYSLHKLLGDQLGGAPPVVHHDGAYSLNVQAGVQVDVACFTRLVSAGDRALRAGDRAAAMLAYDEAIRLYRGDLRLTADNRGIIEREHLRATFLTVLARLADHHFDACDYRCCLEHALRLLACDPCREDAHRLVMRCYVRLGERAQALRQFRLCERILQTEFDAAPEAATIALFDRVRLAPETV